MFTEPLKTILGYYGKVPTNGDFICKGLPRSFVDPWDLWLQEAILTSRQQLGDQWLDFYLTSPLYRFVLSPGICGENGWLGILMPSVDKAGRYYPMTVSQMNHNNPFDTLQQLEWFIKLENLALSCLKDGYSLQEFNNEIVRLSTEISSGISAPLSLVERIDNRVFGAAWQKPLNSPDSITGLIPSMLDNLLKERCFAYSLWWTKGSEHVSPSLLFSEGLPPYDSVAAMFDGNWQQWGWANNHYPNPF
jgi:type VI secretion system protein ImpM